MSKNVEQTYKKLNEIEHVLLRPGRYLGTIDAITQHTYLIENEEVTWRDVTYSPAFLKIFDEVISNSADFSKRPEGSHLTTIKVEIDRGTGQISIYDNGGIPVVKHSEYDQYVPDMIFGELRSGSNFDDDEDSVSTGQNGEGSTICNIFSTEFIVETADGKNKFTCVYSNNMNDKTDPKVTKSKEHFTKITYIPDYKRFGLTLDDDHYAILIRRVYEIAATNTHLNVEVNGTKINFKKFKDFAKMFSKDRIDFGNDRLEMSAWHSVNGFQQVSFVNSTNVFQGGTHVEYIMNMLVNSIRDYVKKKTKQDIKPSDIRNHFFLMINATINNPRYNSQTKEKLETQVKDFGVSYEISDKVVQQILKSDIVEEIIAWAENKQKMEELAALRKKNKDLDKNSLRNITKYEPATSKNRHTCELFVAEGDSAAKSLQSARNPDAHGVFPLKGKPLNVRNMKLSQLLANEELSNLMQILGLQFGKEHFIYELRYNKLVIATDQDLDGHHLCSLIINIFYHLWPSLVKEGFLYKLQTPIVRVSQSKKEIEFLNLDEFRMWESKQTKPYQANYLKGLGSNDTKYFKTYMFDKKYLTPITWEDAEDVTALDIAFDKTKADERKEFIYGIK